MSAVFFTVCYIVYLSCGALGAPTQSWQPPLDDKVAMRETLAPSWVSAPRTRGTFEILYSCTFTLALCVYTAIHLNVPGPKESQFTFYRRKTKWVLIALFAPEVVLYTAWFQWYQARQYYKDFNRIVDKFKRKANTTNAPSIPVSSEPVKDISTTQITGDDDGPRVNPDETTKTPPSSIRYMTLLDGFYAVMGGFVVDLPEAGTLRRSTITPEGILRLADRDVFCMVSHQTIQDKSKADVLAKILVCFQVSFLVIQSSARKAGGYPLTLLEVHTLVHVVCALFMYALWFRKPLNIQDPTVVEATEVVEDCFRSQTPDGSEYLRSRARNIIVFTKENDGSLIPLFFGLTAICAAYGGVHLSA